MSQAKFPWDAIKAETLRSVCKEIGVRSRSNRADMIEFLKLVEQLGLEAAMKAEVGVEPRLRSNKRGRSDHDHDDAQSPSQSHTHDYDTRRRGKRARKSDPGPGIGRATRNGDQMSLNAAPKHARKFASSAKFDGVLLPTRRGSGHKKLEGVAGETDMDADADLDLDLEAAEEEVVQSPTAIGTTTGDVEEVGEVGGGADEAQAVDAPKETTEMDKSEEVEGLEGSGKEEEGAGELKEDHRGEAEPDAAMYQNGGPEDPEDLDAPGENVDIDQEAIDQEGIEVMDGGTENEAAAEAGDIASSVAYSAQGEIPNMPADDGEDNVDVNILLEYPSQTVDLELIGYTTENHASIS